MNFFQYGQNIEITSSGKNLPCLRSSFYMAEKVEKKLGRSEILFREMPTEQNTGRYHTGTVTAGITESLYSKAATTVVSGAL